jgi:hypothetical protein
MNEFDELNDNINNLITELRNKDDKQDLSSLNDFVETTKNYDKYLSEIHTNTRNINETLNAYLKSVNTLETADVNAEIEVVPTLNNNIEQQAFVDYNEELKLLVQRVGELSLQLANMKNDVDIDIDLGILDNLSEKIKEANLKVIKGLSNTLNDTQFDVNINSESLSNEIALLSEKIKELEEPINLYFSTNMEQIQTSLSELETKEIDIISKESLSTSLNTVQEIDTVLAKLSEYKSNSIDLDINTNIDDITTTLQELKDVKLDIVFNMDSMQSNITTIQTSLQEIKAEFGVFNIDANINLKHNMEDVKANINDIASELSITPKLDVNLKAENINNGIKATPEVDSNKELLKPEIVNVENVLPSVETKANDADTFEKMKEYFEANTQAINELKNSISNVGNTNKGFTETTTPNKDVAVDKPKKGITEVKKVNNQPNEQQNLIDAMNTIASLNKQILLELKKNNFLSSKD